MKVIHLGFTHLISTTEDTENISSLNVILIKVSEILRLKPFLPPCFLDEARGRSGTNNISESVRYNPNAPRTYYEHFPKRFVQSVLTVSKCFSCLSL